MPSMCRHGSSCHSMQPRYSTCSQHLSMHSDEVNPDMMTAKSIQVTCIGLSGGAFTAFGDKGGQIRPMRQKAYA